MKLGLKDKVAIIGGSSKGLGKSCAISLANEGVNIVLCARGKEALKKTSDEIKNLGVKVLPLVVDMASKTDNQKIINETLRVFGRIDILVNNSGGPKPGTFEELTEDDWDDAYNSVFKYQLRMIQGCLPVMEKNNWGRIINITSLSVKEPAPSLILSNVFRIGVVSFAKSISKDLISKGITINNICPGAFKTDRAKELMLKKADLDGTTLTQVEQNAIKNFPQKRFQKPNELGDLVSFLASNSAESITGTTIRIDGGISSSLF